VRAARPFLAGLLLATLTLAVRAAPSRAAKREADIVAAFSGLVGGPSTWPPRFVVVDGDGRLRTLELGDHAPLHLRLTIPF
jgi:hypothetical protein